VGSASYRGYFSKRGAVDEAERLRAQGFDVFVGGVQTYSTLGWFDDPLLNTFIDEPEAVLAEILFHEMAHLKFFVAGDSDFNEAFATAVAQEGVRRWLEHRGRPELLDRYQRESAQERAFVALVNETIGKLDAVYGDARLSPQDKRARKAQLIEELRAGHEKLKTQWGGLSPFEGWFAGPINNAKLGTVATYYGLVPAFDALLKTCDGDLPRFFAAVKEVSKRRIEEREKALWAQAGQ
jgi:predicted aminopeptidase